MSFLLVVTCVPGVSVGAMREMVSSLAVEGSTMKALPPRLRLAAYANLAGDMYTEIVAKCYTAYQKELRQSEAMDFDDLIMLTLRLFDQNPDVLTYYQQRYQYIHVDEYQDTNHASLDRKSVV